MTTVVCTSCGEIHKGPFRLAPDELSCPCGGRRVSPSQAKPRKPMKRVSDRRQEKVHKQGMLKRTRRRETSAEKRARLHFNATVKSWPCWFSRHRPCEQCEGAGGELDPIAEVWVECSACEGDGRHHCIKPKDAHHLVPKDFLRKRFQAVLPEPQFVAILFHPRIGAPLCRKAHEAVETRADRIYWEDLSPECLEYVGSLPEFVQMRLELECPKRPEAVAR